MTKNRKLITFTPKREEVTTDYRELHNEEFDTVYSPSHIIGMIKKLRKVGHVARVAR
jgi:hypothetical protein